LRTLAPASFLFRAAVAAGKACRRSCSCVPACGGRPTGRPDQPAAKLPWNQFVAATSVTPRKSMRIPWRLVSSARRCKAEDNLLSDQAPALIWEKSREAFYASVKDASGTVRFYLIVEPLGARWHWSVWRPGESILEALHGSAPTAQEAMRYAEQVAT
jgi:hypothetical protein